MLKQTVIPAGASPEKYHQSHPTPPAPPREPPRHGWDRGPVVLRYCRSAIPTGGGLVLAAERRARVLEAVHARGAASVAELSETLGVSAMTIRRDLDTLAGEGLLDKVHGGATTRRTASAEEVGFDDKARRERAEKEAIAARAAALVEPGMAIGLSAGTTTWALARRLRSIPRLTVVTNSLRIADLLHGPPLPGEEVPAEVVLTGGVRTASDALVGPVAVAALEQLHCDIVFLGVHGMDVTAGLTTPNLLEAQTDRALVAAGRSAVVVADHTKWGTVGLSTILPLTAVDHLVTDDGLAPEAVGALREMVADVHLAPLREPAQQRPAGLRER